MLRIRKNLGPTTPIVQKERVAKTKSMRVTKIMLGLCNMWKKPVSTRCEELVYDPVRHPH